MFEWKSTDEKQLQNQIKTKSKHHEGHLSRKHWLG